jgi:Flp pilus assembly protein TadB
LSSPPTELPRSVRKGPPITVTCECGERRELKYGEKWRCESCGRRYDTGQIPVEEYAAFRRNRVHDRILPSAVFAFAFVVAVVLILTGRGLAAIVVVPLIGFIWGSFVRPRRRRRQYREIAERPRWNLRAD